MSTPRSFTRGNFRPNNQNPNNFPQHRSTERRVYTDNKNDRYNDYRARSPYQSNQDKSRNWGNNDNFSRSLSMSRQDSSFKHYRNQPRSSSPNPSVFNRFGNQNPSNNISYEKKFPTSNNGNQPNVVRFTTTNGEINELSGLCPLNYKGLRVQLLISPEIQDSALIFFFATGDTQKDSSLEIEFMLDTGASSSIINYRTFWEICQTQHPISVKRSTIQTKTYSGQVVPMIGLTTLTFIYDPDGQLTFPLTVWITEMKTQSLLGMDFCQKQVSGIHFELPGIELKEPPITVCYGSLHQNKSYPFISQILTIRTPHAMHIEAKSARCCKYSPEDPHNHFPTGSTFQPNRNAVATGLSFVNVLCTQSESKLPILMENNKNHQITLPKGRIGFSSLDISDKDEPRYQIHDPYELKKAILLTN